MIVILCFFFLKPWIIKRETKKLGFFNVSLVAFSIGKLEEREHQ